MKTKLIKAATIAVVVLFTATINLQAQVVIGSDKLPEDFSALELVSTAGGVGGLLLPRMNTAPASPAIGLMFYNTSNNKVNIYGNGSSLIVWDTPAAAPTHTAVSVTPILNGVTIGNDATPEPFAVLEVNSTEGIRLPLITNAQRLTLQSSLTSIAGGLIFFNTTSNKVNIWNGGGWIE